MSGITGMLHVSPISPRHTTRHHPDEMTTDDETFVRFIYKKCNFSFGRFNDDDPTYCVKTLVLFFFLYISPYVSYHKLELNLQHLLGKKRREGRVAEKLEQI